MLAALGGRLAAPGRPTLWEGASPPPVAARNRRYRPVGAAFKGASDHDSSRSGRSRGIGGSGGGSGAAADDGSVGSSGGGSSSGGSNMSSTGRSLAPWTLTFDLKDRDMLWTDENKARLVRIVAGYQLDLEVGEVEERLSEVQVLLPLLASRCAAIKPSTLAGLLRDPGALVPRLISLRALLPGVDIGRVAAAEPELLLLRDLGEVQADLERLRAMLGLKADVDALVQEQPSFLDAELVSEVMGELRRLVPAADPVRTLLSDPSWLLRVERGCKRLGDDPDS